MNPETIAVGGGRIGLGHRPKKTVLPSLREQGFTHVVTLLGSREGAEDLIDRVKAADLESIWLPLDNGEPVVDPERLASIRHTFVEMEGLLAAGAQLFFHCSAGIHRTGMVVNGFLLSLGFEPEEAERLLGELRTVTVDGVTDRRLEWGHQFASR